jgi:hypothetical protein
MYETLPIATTYIDTFSLGSITAYIQSLVSTHLGMSFGMNQETMAMLGYATYLYVIMDAGNGKGRRRR